MENVLIVEDEQYMLDLMNIHLADSHIITVAKNGLEALNLIRNHDFDLIILDVMLPSVDGWTICEKIRENYDTPILMLTARSEVSDKVKGLELGADDYLTKPFEFDELKARIKALLRRAKVNKDRQEGKVVYLNGQFIINNMTRQVRLLNQDIDLTEKEFDLLFILANSPQRVFTRNILIDKVWDYEEDLDLRIVDTHIKNIREKFKKISREIKLIETVWGVGYKFNSEEAIKK